MGMTKPRQPSDTGIDLPTPRRTETPAEVTAQIAHDLTNLLTPLTSYPDLLREALPDGSPEIAMVDEMQAAALNIAQLNQQLLAFGLRGRWAPEPVDLNALVPRAVTSARIPSGIAVRLDLAHDLAPARGAGAQLLRVLVNLIVNAVEAMGAEGELTIETREAPGRPGGRLRPGRSSDAIEVTVSDTGPGIAPTVRERIFEPFFSTKDADTMRGAGLGLSVVRAVVEDHCGAVTVESRPGAGTTFHVRLPTMRDETIAPIEPPAPPSHLSGTILVADDDRAERRTLRRLLEASGLSVSTARSGAEAIRACENVAFDLVLLNDGLDSRPDGTQTLRSVRAIDAAQRAIVLSSLPESEQAHAAQALGAGLLLRPFTNQGLLRAIEAELGESA